MNGREVLLEGGLRRIGLSSGAGFPAKEVALEELELVGDDGRGYGSLPRSRAAAGMIFRKGTTARAIVLRSLR
jgi:hypothetical protein